MKNKFNFCVTLILALVFLICSMLGFAEDPDSPSNGGKTNESPPSADPDKAFKTDTSTFSVGGLDELGIMFIAGKPSARYSSGSYTRYSMQFWKGEEKVDEETGKTWVHPVGKPCAEIFAEGHFGGDANWFVGKADGTFFKYSA